MNIVVIIDDVGAEVYKKWSDVEKYHDLKKEDFVQHGKDFICGMDKSSNMISKDIKLLETVASTAVFGKPKVDWLTAFATAACTAVTVIIFM